jgi:DUF4097 and DUF4098 domain-containing protein YvlB
VPSISRGLLALFGVAFAVLAAALLFGGGARLDERLPVGPGGALAADIALGEGFSSDEGSLRIRSHEDGDVRVLAETSGWGTYAVDFDLSQAGDRVSLVGRVEGALHWLFGGPTVRVSVWVPHDFTVDAHIAGAPLILEDLVGPVTARVDAGDVTLRRARGKVSLANTQGSLEFEDVEGDLELRSQNGEIDVRGVQGSVSVTADHGSVEIESVRGPVLVGSKGGRLHGSVDVESVTGPVSVESGSGQVEIEGVRGEVTVTTDRGHVEADDVEGDVVARTTRGDVQLEQIEGGVRAYSERGSIEVEFDGDPHGEIETGRGGIEIRAPEGARFDLDARTERGRIEGAHADSLESAAAGDEDGVREDGSREAQVVQAINGGGRPLRLRTGRGSIRVDH